MGFVIRTIALPLVFGVLAGAIALALRTYASFSDFRTLIIGCALFCVFMVLSNHIQFAWQTERMRRRLAAIFGLEDNLLRRVQEIETVQSNAELIESLHARITLLEDAEEARNNRLQDEEPLAGFNSENVVMLKSKRDLGDRLPDKPVMHRRTIRNAITANLAEKNICVRLQPIINLLTKEIEAVEAFGFMETRNGKEPVEGLLEHFTDEQRCEYDLTMLGILARASRKMEADGQSLPIHHTLVSISVPKHSRWSKIISLFKADAKLAATLVPQLPLETYARLDNAQTAKFLELKEYGMKPGITECKGVEPTLRVADEKRFAMMKIPVTELLRYTAREGERAAHVLLPRLSSLGIRVVATGIEKAHQAANLIDLDLRSGQGNFISPARGIKLDGPSDDSRVEAT